MSTPVSVTVITPGTLVLTLAAMPEGNVPTNSWSLVCALVNRMVPLLNDTGANERLGSVSTTLTGAPPMEKVLRKLLPVAVELLPSRSMPSGVTTGLANVPPVPSIANTRPFAFGAKI